MGGPILRNPVAAAQLEHAYRQKYARAAASHFLQCISQRAVAIRRQRLQNFKKRRSGEDDAAHKDGAPRMGEAKKHANEQKVMMCSNEHEHCVSFPLASNWRQL
jgi:hypothetical protein